MANATVQRLLLMVADMKTSENIRENIEEKLKSLSAFEKSEFEKRFRFILNSILIKNNLVKQSNALQETYQSYVEAKTRLQNKLVLLLAFLFLASYLFYGQNTNLYFLWGLIFVLAIVIDVIKSTISEARYSIMLRNFIFEIQRYENDINQYGFFTQAEVDLISEYDEEDESLIDKFRKKKIQAEFELQLAILGYMNLEVELENDN